jgi:hypothetical protein
MQKLWRRYWHGSDLGAILVLISISVGMFWKITLTNQYTWLNSPDFSQQVAPWFQFQAREWHQHRFPLWDPYHWAGQPLIGQMQPGAMYPLNWLVFLAPLKDGFISIVLLHWYMVVIHFHGGPLLLQAMQRPGSLSRGFRACRGRLWIGRMDGNNRMASDVERRSLGTSGAHVFSSDAPRP